MSVTENVKKKRKQKKNTIRSLTALFTVGGHFDSVKIRPNQQDGTEPGKVSI